jgi:hypothetical protein
LRWLVERNLEVFFLQESCEIEHLVGCYDVRGALHAARPELWIAEKLIAERFGADLAERMSARGALPVVRRRWLAAVEGCH